MKNDRKIKKKTLVALDIGTSHIKIALGRYTNKKLIIKKTITIDTPDKCISNGRIRDVEVLTKVLGKTLHEHNIKNVYAVITIKSSGIINREMILPYNENEKEVDKIVFFEMKQFLTIKLDEYVTQYQIIEDYYDDKTRFMKIMVTTLEKDVVESYYKLLKAVHLKPYALDIHFNTINKFFKLYNDHVSKLNDTIAVIDVGYNSTDISIVSGGSFKMSRTLMIGSNVLEHMLQEEFNSSFDKDEMRRLLIKKAEEVKVRMNDVLTPLADEVSNVIRYYISRDIKNEVKKIYITGGIVNQPEIKYILEERLDLPTCSFDNLDRLIVSSDKIDDTSSFYAVLGAMVRL
ncbi:MAG: pilus assembly protein PilM [Clostridiales bacterium]|nr:pilus assembly protein PilM [Clostridiales bacterium]